MNFTLVTLRAVLVSAFLFSILLLFHEGFAAEEFAVPNSRSPYQNLAEKYPLAIGLEMFRHSAPGDTLYPEIDATNVSARKRKYLFRQSSDETGRGATAVKKRKRPSDA